MNPKNSLTPAFSASQSLSLAWGEGPPTRLAALLGPAGMLRLCPWLLTPALLAGEHVFIADGGNSFNPYDLSRTAQWVGQAPRDLLRRVHLSWVFTCHQMLALVRSLPRLIAGTGCRLAVLWDPLSTFYDEAVPAGETQRLSRQRAGKDAPLWDGSWGYDAEWYVRDLLKAAASLAFPGEPGDEPPPFPQTRPADGARRPRFGPPLITAFTPNPAGVLLVHR